MKIFCVILLLILFGYSIGSTFIPKSELQAALYPKWAHSHWVWLSSDQSNETSVLEFVQGFLDRNISVGGVDIDSMWAGVNDFVWNNRTFPNPKQLIDTLHSKNIRVICWTTSLVNTNTPIYAYGKEKGYFLNKGRTVKWWHGEGSFIDYTNPEGLAWWHQQMDKVLDIGLDGFKCDGTDPYTLEFIVIEAHSGVISERDYANSYYSDFFNYSRSKNDEALIMSRPVDSYKEVYWQFSPREVVFSGWVGDQNPNFGGLQDALRNMFHSAWDKYVGFGSDIGGYRYGEGPLGRTKELFVRWAQLGSFCSLMENGGNQEHRPWMFDNTNQTVDIYRFFVDQHYSLQTYLLSAGTTAYETNVSIMKPVAEWTIFNPSSWDYWLWKDVFVCPMVENSTQRLVLFPKGDDFVDWYNNTKVYQGGSTLNYYTPLSMFPVFHRRGSLLPLEITKKAFIKGGNQDGGDLMGLGDESCADALTLLLLHPKPYQKEKINIREWKQDSQEISYSFSSHLLQFTITPHSRNLLFCIKGVTSPSDVLIQTGFNVKKSLTHCPSCSLSQLNLSSSPSYTLLDDLSLWIRIPGSSLENGSILSVVGVDNTFKTF